MEVNIMDAEIASDFDVEPLQPRPAKLVQKRNTHGELLQQSKDGLSSGANQADRKQRQASPEEGEVISAMILRDNQDDEQAPQGFENQLGTLNVQGAPRMPRAMRVRFKNPAPSQLRNGITRRFVDPPVKLSPEPAANSASGLTANHDLRRQSSDQAAVPHQHLRPFLGDQAKSRPERHSDQSTHPELKKSAWISGDYLDPKRWTMAEVFADDRRNRGYGGGGYGGGGRGKKRRYDDEDDFDRRPQRRYPPPEQPSRKVTRQILSVADDLMRNSPINEVMDIARAINDNYDDEIFRSNIIGLFPTLIIEQPLRVPFAAAIVLNLHKQKPEMIPFILEAVVQKTQEKLDEGDWRSFKLLFRFIASLHKLSSQDVVFPVLDELFNRAVDLQTASEDDTLGFELVKIVMLTIPYVLVNSPSQENVEKATAILGKTAVIASAPSESSEASMPFVNVDADSPAKSYPFLSLLQAQLQNEAQAGWPLTIIPRLVEDIDVFKNGTNGTDAETSSRTYDFPQIRVPEKINPGPKPIFPEVFFSLYADQDVETVPPTSNIASTLIRDALVDTINSLDFNRVKTSEILIKLDNFWAPKTFADRGTAFDSLKDIPAGSSTWKPEDLAVDAIFSQILVLPEPEHKIVYYHSMITETTRLAPGAIAPSLGRAIRYLYRALDIMDLELFYRFMDWFAHHLSNFDYRWKWAEWVDDAALSPLQPRKAFIIGAIDKEIRLAFAKRIRDTLPEPYHFLVPSTRDNEIPQFKYNDTSALYAAEGKQILQLIRAKGSDEDFQQVFAQIHNAEAARDSSADPLVASTDAYVTAICYIGSKSLSHVLNYIERHKERLAGLAPASPAASRQVVASVLAYWVDVQPGVAVSIVDKLLNYGIVSPATVLDFALRDPTLLPHAWAYELVAGTMRKVTGRVRNIARARVNGGIPVPAAAATNLESTLETELDAMRALFRTIDGALASVSASNNNDLSEDATLLRDWADRWSRTFRRKLAVEEGVVRECAKMFPAPGPDEVEVEMDDGNGAAAENGNGAMDDEIL